MNLLELGAAANAERERRHGNRVYFALVPHEVAHVECAAEALDAALAGLGTVTALAVCIEGITGQTTGEAEIRAIAQARVSLSGVAHIAADWTRLTPEVAQVALRFGADQLTGIPAGTPKKEILRLIAEAGREAFECDAEYRAYSAAENPLPVLDS